MNALGVLVAALLVGFSLFILWKVTRDLWNSRENLFLLLRFTLVAAFLVLAAYILYQNFDVSDLLMGLLWLSLGIFLLAALLATVEKLEGSFRSKQGDDEDNDSLPL